MELPSAQSFLPLPHLPFHILLALADGGATHGWAIIKRIRQMTGDTMAPSSGSSYLAMVRLEDRGLLEEVAPPPDDTDQRRRYYRLTPLGRRVLEAESQRLSALVDMARAHRVLGRSGPRP